MVIFISPAPSLSVCQSQGTEEQKAKWLQDSRDYKIIGAYAQTELGHGVSEISPFESVLDINVIAGCFLCRDVSARAGNHGNLRTQHSGVCDRLAHTDLHQMVARRT